MYTLDSIVNYGAELNRPESVIAFRDGGVFASDKEHGIVRVEKDTKRPIPLSAPLPEGFLVNGITYAPNQGFLVANIGNAGGVWRLTPGSAPTPVLTVFNGAAMPPTNYVHADANGFWVSVSTRQSPRHLAYNSRIADGFILRVGPGGTTVVADNIAYANEVRPSPDNKWLYFNETMGHRLSRVPITGGKKQVIHTFGKGDFVDGLGFDDAGGIWVVSIISNRVWRLSPTETECYLEDADAQRISWVEKAFSEGTMERSHMDKPMETRLKNISSLTWAGESLNTILLGSLLGDSLYAIKSKYRGVKPLHWDAPSPF